MNLIVDNIHNNINKENLKDSKVTNILNLITIEIININLYLDELKNEYEESSILNDIIIKSLDGVEKDFIQLSYCNLNKFKEIIWKTIKNYSELKLKLFRILKKESESCKNDKSNINYEYNFFFNEDNDLNKYFN